TPMNGILGFANLLKEPNLSSSEKNQYIGIIENSGNRLLNTVNDLIDFSKIEAGQMKVSISKVNINELIEQLYTFFNVEAQKKGLILVADTSL
ncbi:MAG: histidine kinase dimerization/phospho-acceptor domain-containing protein, partial [Bacteroidales bacterium]